MSLSSCFPIDLRAWRKRDLLFDNKSRQSVFSTYANSKQIIDSNNPEECVPLYLRYNDPMCVPILSHNTPTNNVLLKIEVPKRTGRKRKRGSQDPFAHDPNAPKPPELRYQGINGNLLSYSRLDNAAHIRRSLHDNVKRCKVEVVGEIRQTHRYRGKNSGKINADCKLIYLQVSLISSTPQATQSSCPDFKSILCQPSVSLTPPFPSAN